MQVKGMCRTIAARALVALLAVALVFTMMPLNRGFQAHAADALTTQTPVLVVTGQGLIGNGGAYSASNVSKEKSYTLDELKNLTEAQGKVTKQKYSAKKSQDPYAENYYLVNGVKVASLLGKTEAEVTDDVKVIASDRMAVTFKQGQEYVKGAKTTPGLNVARYFYDLQTREKGDAVPAVIGWADVNTGLTDGSSPTALPTGEPSDIGFLRLYLGQYDGGEGSGADDYNQPLWNGKSSSVQVNKVQEGEAISETVLTVENKEYTRADVLMMDFAERTYEYDNSKGHQVDNVRGVPFSVLLKGEDEDSKVSFTAADGYDMSETVMTVKQLIDKNYMLAYELKGSGIYKTAKPDANNPDGYGFLTLYGDGVKPASMINGISVKKSSGIDFSKSPYKHITNGGITGQEGPYKIDSITGATLTIEGPGMTASTPLSVKDLENKNSGASRGVYTDTRDGQKVKRTYEGIDLYYVLTGLESSGIKMTDKAQKVTIKNRNRKAIATLSLEDVKAMHDAGRPAIVSYGTAYEDGTNARPYVFNDASGEDKTLGNGDGCLKFVYDLDEYGDQSGKYTKFGNMAYIYVEEAEAPGFKHDKAPYKKAENSQYVLTVTGDELGCEVNYTVEELEKMVEYDTDGNVVDNGYGYRDEYSLANSSYWYVNTYEGVKMWSLLQHSGIDKDRATDEDTKVTFRSTDNYTGFDTFSLAEVADPDRFGFYEKNAADGNDGTYKPNENIRQGDDVTTGDKLAVGYPVLVSYGANEYPYVISKNLDGFLSGLSNDGGPLRVISGKRDYNHANGSNQAKLLDKIIVGDNNYNYSTHTYQPDDSVYKTLKDSGLKVTINDGSKETVKDYTVEDLENLIYDGSLTKTQLGEAKIKGFYEVPKNGEFYSDLYEGVNLNFFLKDVVQLAGEQGSITFKTDTAGVDPVVMSLEDVLAVNNGYNAKTELGGLSPVIAYAKNGYPLVTGKTVEEGFVKNQTLKGIAEGEADKNHTVQNNNGPLQLIFPRANAEATDTMGSLANITEIEINLEADKYAHVAEPYNAYSENTLTVQGEGTRQAEPKTFTVSDLEGKQSLAVTKDYSFRNNGGTVSQTRYRGLNLYKFLKSTYVGLKTNADKVLIYAEGVTDPYEFTLSEISKDTYKNTVTSSEDLPVMLAYGSASVENADVKDGKPLVEKSSSEGYDADYGNDGGPLKLVIGQTDETDVNKGKCVKNVTKIEVTASEQVSWNHSSQEVFKQYLDDEVAFKVVDTDGGELASKTYKVSELEAMTDIISQEEIYAVSSNTWEGLNFWQLIQKTFRDVDGINDPITITITSKDGFSAEAIQKVGLDGLKNGVKDGENYIPVMLCYAVDGYPLASGGKGAGAVMGEGYDSSIDNKGGPMRLMVEKIQGACIMEVVNVTIKVGQAEPEEAADFTVDANTLDKPKGYSVSDLKALTATEKEYTVKGGTEKVRGVLLKDLLDSLDIKDDSATFNIDAGGFGGEGTYTGLSLKDAIDQDYLVAYEEYINGEWKPIDDTSKTPNSKVRIYRNYLENNPEADQTKWFNKCQYISGITVSVPEKTVFDVYEGTSQPGDLPLSGVRCTRLDKDGNLWVATYGGGIACKEKGKDTFKVYNLTSEPALLGTTISSLCPDDKGGVWFSQNTSHKNVSTCFGVGYLKDGQVTYYRASDDPKTVPSDYCSEINIDNKGNVWFGCIGGLTKYDPKNNTWETISEGLPASKIKDGIPLEQTGYIENIEFDKDGGIWCGFYPDCEGGNDGKHPYVAGIAYIKDGQVKHSYKFTSEQEGEWYRLQDVWIRDIAIDKKGGIWCVASSIYGGMQNIGGKVYYISSTDAEPVEYSGFDLFGEDAFSENSELRMVTVDPDGGLWFSTSKDGVFRVDDPTIVEGKLTMTAQYSSSTGSWPAGYDNIYSLTFLDDTLYAGSSKGLTTHKFEFQGEPEPPATDDFGDKADDKEAADLTITGDALARSGYFSIKGIKNAEGVTKVDATIHTLNSSGTEADVTVQGVTLENLVDLAGLAEGEEIDSVEIISSDDRKTTYTAEQALSEDIQGNKAMYIWTEGTDKVNKVVRGQFSSDDKNKGAWAKDVKKIIFHKSESVKPAGDATADTAQLTITGDALSRDGYYTIKGIKNDEGVTKVDATINWLNSEKNTGSAVVQGVTLENIVDIVGLAEGAEIDSVEILSDDGKVTNYTAEQAFSKDIQGNKAMYIWTEDGAKVNKVVRGQLSEGDTNKGGWAKNVVKITFNKKAESSEADAVIETISKLPAADKITVDDADAIVAAREAYDALTDEEKALVTNLDKLEAAEAALDNAVKEGFIEKGEELIDSIDFSEYSATTSMGLWLNIQRLELRLNAAKDAAEAAQIYNKIKETIANAPTLADEVRASFAEYPVEVAAKQYQKDSIKVTWSKVPKAEAYNLYRSESPDSGFKKIKVVTTLSFVDEGREIEKSYFYKVKPKKSVNGKFVYGEASEAAGCKVKLGKPVISSIKAGKKKATLKWGKVLGADGYVIYRYSRKTGSFKAVKTIKSGSTVKYVNKKLKGKRTYYYKMKAFKTVDGKRIYSKISKSKKVRTKR